MLQEITRKLRDRFAGGGYYRSTAEGRVMKLHEIKDHPIYRKFNVLFDSDFQQVLQVEAYMSLGLQERRNSLTNPGVLDELKELLDHDQIVATVFMEGR